MYNKHYQALIKSIIKSVTRQQGEVLLNALDKSLVMTEPAKHVACLIICMFLVTASEKYSCNLGKFLFLELDGNR